MTDERLGRFFEDASGMPCEAKWLAAKDFQARWVNGNGRCSFSVSDYLEDAPDIVLIQFAEAIVSAMRGRKAHYGPEYMEWMTSASFVIGHRPTYLRRSKNLARTTVGERDLLDSVQRLLDSELVSPSDIDTSYFSWTKHPNVRKFGYCSPLMRTVAISCALDSPDVPEDALDYVVYHECLHLRQGYRPFARSHDAEFRREESKYPRKKEMDAIIRSIADGK
jgi:hypothetical protein